MDEQHSSRTTMAARSQSPAEVSVSRSLSTRRPGSRGGAGRGEQQRQRAPQVALPVRPVVNAGAVEVGPHWDVQLVQAGDESARLAMDGCLDRVAFAAPLAVARRPLE